MRLDLEANLTTVRTVVAQAAAAVLRHPRRVAATVLAVLTGFGVTAIAISPLAPDAADLPRRMVTEVVEPEAIAPQLEALAGHTLQLERSEVTRANDTADSLLRRLGLRDPAMTAWLRTDSIAKRLFSGRPGKMVSVSLDSKGGLQRMVARFPVEANGNDPMTHFWRLTVEDSPAGLRSSIIAAPLETHARLASGTIRSSLFAATDDAGVPDAVAVQMTEMFSTEVDFHRELRKGDTFSVVYETLMADGEPVAWNDGVGRVLAAEFVNGGKSHQAFWFNEGKGGYFDANGKSNKRAFLASPLEFSRVTSGFAMRFHPILRTWRAHLGTDYGAPTGTPVRVVGDGVVDFAGVQGGYGNVVQVKHSGDRMTVYAHLSRIDVRKGQRVEQGQRIGAVGATGWATGPHLHFEFRIDGVHQDPLRIAKASETLELDAVQRPKFAQLAKRYQTKLDVADDLNGLAGRVD
ncbi:MAG: peptidase M23 [Ideonella sp. MAG2]|nr:MAG: peptidase M23 [Ideonella sp. MAG2]